MMQAFRLLTATIIKATIGFSALTAMVGAHAASAEDVFANRPAFSGADLPARSSAKCDEIRGMSSDLPQPDVRIDLSVVGELTAVKTDGALWYLITCNLPDVRIMCVTYQSNDMKPGDRVFMQGGYSRIDANHIVLDPCLANRFDADPQAGPGGKK